MSTHLNPNTTDDLMIKSKTFASKDLVILDMETLWLIEEGIIKTATWNEDGVNEILGYWGKSDVIGYPLSQLQPYYIQCLSSTRLLQVSLDSSELIASLIKHNQNNEIFIDILHQTSVKSRILDLLKWLCHRFGEPCGKAKLLPFQLTHQDIADTICSSRVTVTRLLGELEHEHKIGKCGRLILVK